MLPILAALLVAQSAAAPQALNESTFAAIRSHASPTKQDLAFQGIEWKTSVFDGLLQAQREDKPMVMWMYFGDPRGRC
jgi:hypothetical protein